METGKTLWVFGVDSAGMYYNVMMSGLFFWMPVGNMRPNYDEVWNGNSSAPKNCEGQGCPIDCLVYKS